MVKHISSGKGRDGETIGDKQFKAFLKKTTCIHICTIICSITCNENVFQMYIHMYYFIDNSDFSQLNTNKKLSLEKSLKAEL